MGEVIALGFGFIAGVGIQYRWPGFADNAWNWVKTQFTGPKN